MDNKYCPYCKCLILKNGKCRNSACIMGNREAATLPQLETIYKLCSQLNIDVSGKDPDKLTKEKASMLIKKLITRKALQEVNSEEDDDE